jgi:hypothetical protein
MILLPSPIHLQGMRMRMMMTTMKAIIAVAFKKKVLQENQKK